jgi:hypothetical protein
MRQSPELFQLGTERNPQARCERLPNVGPLGRAVLPGLLIWAGAGVLLAAYGTPWAAILAFSVYLVVGIMLPGVLLWRWLRRNTDGFAADLPFGTGLAFALSILLYIPGRAIGVPLLPVVIPVATVAAFLTVKRLRPYWRSTRAPMPSWCTWSVAAALVLALWVITRNGLQIEPIAFPDASFQYSDMPYQLALAGELKHHLPGQIPFVIGQSLDYHWFLHAEAAAASWSTGIELDLLLRRLLPVTAALLPVLSVAALATRLAKKSWAGPLAASAWGITLLLDDGRIRLRELVPRIAAALAVGMILAKILSATTPDRPSQNQGILAVSVQVILPWLAVLLVAVVITLVLTRTTEATRALGLAVLVVFGVAAVHIPATVATTLTEPVCVSGPDRPECRHTRRQIPAGGAEAARYIRDHSKPSDRLATNSHCTPVYTERKCDARNFWLSA